MTLKLSTEAEVAPIVDGALVKVRELCADCGETQHEYWWDCPEAPRTMNYGWKFGRGMNTARNEKFYAQAAADPFGHLGGSD